MSKWLGVAYNKWHGIFSALVMVIAIGCSGFYLEFDSLQVQFLLALLIGLVASFALQAGNESKQALSKTIVQDYGSYENFQKNSRDDWRWWVIGVVAGTIIGGILFAILRVM